MLVRQDQNWQAAWFAKIHKAGDSCMTAMSTVLHHGWWQCPEPDTWRLATLFTWSPPTATEPGPRHCLQVQLWLGNTQISRHRVTLSHTIMHAIELPAPAKKQKRSVFSHFGSVYIPCLKSNNCHTCPKMSKWVYNSIHTVFWRFCCLTSLIMYLKNTPSISLRPQYRPA